MKTKLIIVLVLLTLVTPFINAEWVQPVDCSKLADQQMVPKEEFTEEEAFCFYGTGYDPDTDAYVWLENVDNGNQLGEQVTVSSNGVLTSIANRITNLVAGIYHLFVKNQENPHIVYPNDIVVKGEDHPPCPEVPEFTTIAAGLALIGAGIIVSKKRRVEG